jgi:hypothetical protein
LQANLPLVDPHSRSIDGMSVYATSQACPEPWIWPSSPPPETVAPLIGELSQRGTRASVVITTGFGGMSHVVSLGEMADVDFGDMLDYLAADQHTLSILMYVESVTSGRKFISAPARPSASNRSWC